MSSPVFGMLETVHANPGDLYCFLLLMNIQYLGEKGMSNSSWSL